MAHKKLKITLEVDVEIVVDSQLITAILQDPWLGKHYSLWDEEAIAEHLAFNFATNHGPLSNLDGFRAMPDDWAQLTRTRWSLVDVDTQDVVAGPNSTSSSGAIVSDEPEV